MIGEPASLLCTQIGSFKLKGQLKIFNKINAFEYYNNPGLR